MESVECEVWSVKCGVRSVKHGVWSEECKVWSVECKVWSEECVKCGVWSVKCVECGVWSGKCRVWSVECKVRSVKCGVWSEESATPATQNDMTTCLETFEKDRFCGFPHRHGDALRENQRLETRRMDAEKRAFRARLPPILSFSARYQTAWNVTKCHACHAKRHDNLLGHIRIGEVFQLPP